MPSPSHAITMSSSPSVLSSCPCQGKFLSNSDETAVAVLHPRSLVVYVIKPEGGHGAAASYTNLNKQVVSHLNTRRSSHSVFICV
jgi:hypothetical protein